MSQTALQIKLFVPMYNVEKWISTTFSSIKKQTFADYEVFFLDDCSTDNTVRTLNVLIGDDPRFSVHVNKYRKFTLQNLWDNIPKFSMHKNDIIVDLDGDDWMANRSVLDKIYKAHQEGSLVTHGTYMHYPGRDVVSEGTYSNAIKKIKGYRNDRWRCSGIRTFRRHLWDHIKMEDITDENKYFYRTTSDLAFMFPILENSDGRIKHFGFDNCFHIYNKLNPLNDDKTRKQEQVETELKIRKISMSRLNEINRERVTIHKSWYLVRNPALFMRLRLPVRWISIFSRI